MSISLHPDASQGQTAAVSPVAGTVAEARPSGRKIRSRLFTRYVLLFVAVVGVALLSNGIFEVFFRYREHEAALIRIQHQQAEAAAAKIGQFIKEIEIQLGWITELPWSADSIEQRRFDVLRLLRQVPAITELAQIDSTGKERLRVSRPAMVDGGLDLSKDSKFTEAVVHKVYYGPVYFRRESEPSMTLSLAGPTKDAGVSIAEVNLKPIWDVVSQIKVGEGGHAYVVDAEGRLIAHPDISLVLRNTDMSRLLQVQAARAAKAGAETESLRDTKNIQGQEVLTTSAPIAPLGWTMFVELPVEEVYASLYPALQRLAIALLGASILAVLAGIFLARRMVGPIQALRAGAQRIGGGDFAQRISIPTGDELEELADQFNDMGARLQESYADLENKVLSRTTELSESLQQQTATADVLKVISRSAFDLDSVLATLVASAAKLCEAEKGVIFLRGEDDYRLVSNYGFSAEFETFARANPYPTDGGSTTTRAAESSGAVQVVDVLADETRSALAREYQRLGGYRTNLGVPLRREGQTIGVFMLARQVVRAFTQRQIELVETFADQAVIAIENVRLFKQVQERTDDLSESLEQQTATSEVLRVISSSPGELEPVFEAVLANATRICGATFGNLFIQDHGAFREVALYNVPAAYAETGTGRLVFPRSDTALGQLARTKQAAQVEDMRALPSYAAGEPQIVAGVELAGIRTVLAVPMLKEDAIVGSINIYRQEVRPFTDKQIQLVQNFANQAVIAIENARLLNELRERTRELSLSLDELRAAQGRLVQTEKLASLGQLTAGIAHEIKNPLNFVNNFSSLSAELIDELNEVLEPAALDAKTRKEIDELSQMLKGNLEKVVQHGKRADSIVKNMLLHSRQGSGEHRPVDINAIVEESLNLAYHGARAEKSGFNITLKRDLDPAAGMIDLYPQEITRVLLNLISNGFYAASKRKKAGEEAFEPTLSATTKNLGNAIEIRIRDNGTGIPLEVREKMFNPFFTTKPAGEGTGLGLSMSHDIVVKQHGGKIDVDTMPGTFTEFIITLPRTAAAQA
jgi:signal transduction histidine kinase/HAMP domain-containing protein